MDWLLVPLATAALVLVAAKAHGRQVRLEREAHGVFRVDFRGTNDPWVEALWRRDRMGFWGLFVGLAIGAMLALFVLRPDPVWAWLGLALAWDLSACFLAVGLASLGRGLRGEGRRHVRSGLGASLAWFGAGLALAGATAVLAA